MFAPGHLALGHLCGKTTSRIFNVDVNLPLLFLSSVIPDIDLLIPSLQHRGPTHSIILFCLVSLIIFTLYGRRAVPYLVALTQHSLLGDYLAGPGVQLLWPLTTRPYGLYTKTVSQASILLEWTLFLISLTSMIKTKDMNTLLQQHPTNLFLVIPIFTVLLPAILGFPLQPPSELTIPHVAYLTLFTLSMLKDVRPQ